MDGDFRLGPWLVSPGLNTIVSSEGKASRLEPKVMDVLVCLAQHAGEPVAKETLIQAVWPGAFVTDDVLRRCISELRLLLEDKAQAPRLIATIPKRGYRLMVPIERIGPPPTPVISPNPAPQPAAKQHSSVSGPFTSSTLGRRTVAALVDTVSEYRRGKHWWMAASGFLAIFGAALLLILLTGLNLAGWRKQIFGPRDSSIRSIAVLPLQNLSADPAQGYFAEGMTDALITDLAQLGSLRVISRASSMRYNKTDKSLPEIARELKVDAIVEGTVQRSGDRVRITAQLIYGVSDKHVWARTYDRELRDAMQLQTELAQDIAQEISASLGDSSTRQQGSSRALNLEAYDDYLKGRNYARRMTRDDLHNGVKYLERSIQRDPTFAPAFAELSFAYQALAWLNHAPPQEVIPKAKAAAEKALTLQNNLATAHTVLGVIYGEYEWDWPAAEREFTRAIQLDPNSSFAHIMYATFLVTVGRTSAAIREVTVATELDPFSPMLRATSSYVFLSARQFDAAVREGRRAVEIDTTFAEGHLTLAAALGANGKFNEAFSEWLQYLRLDSDRALAEELQRAAATLRGSGDPGHKLAYITLRYYQKKSKTEYVAPLTIAAAYVDLGDKDKTIEWLNEAYRERSPGLSAMAVAPSVDPFRSDPGFQELLRRIHLSNEPGNGTTARN